MRHVCHHDCHDYHHYHDQPIINYPYFILPSNTIFAAMTMTIITISDCWYNIS